MCVLLFAMVQIWLRCDCIKGHVNNVMYNRYAESGRVQWAQKYANYIDPAHRREWKQLCGNTGDGLILRAITTEFKFVCYNSVPLTCVANSFH